MLSLISQAVMLLNFLLFMLVRNSNDLYEAFGFVNDKPAFLSFVLFGYLLSPVDEVRVKAAHQRTTSASADVPCNLDLI